MQRAWRRMNERTQARRVIRQRAPLRPAAGPAILPNQFAVDPHPQLFDHKTVIEAFHNDLREIASDNDTFPEHAYRESIDENVTDLSVVQSLDVIVTILILGDMVILRRVSRFEESIFKRCGILCSKN